MKFNITERRFTMRFERALAVMAAIFFLCSTASAQTANSELPGKPTIVIVHGAWGGGWAFKRVDHLLREKGFEVYRATLTGQGERVHLGSPAIGLNTHIDDVVNTIIFEGLRDVVLVGHSYGGMVITGVVDRIPDRIRRVIYLDALLPIDGESMVSAREDSAAFFQKMVKDGMLVPPWLKDQPWPYDVPQSFKTFTDPIGLKNAAARKVPGTYILTVDPGKEAKDDDFYSMSVRAKKRGWPVVQMSADHNPQMSAPIALAALLEKEAK